MKATSFRLTDADLERLERLQREIQCSQADVVRYGLIALKTLVNQGYEFRDLNRTTIFQRSPEGRTVRFFDIADDGSLAEQGRGFQWTEAPKHE